MNKNVISNLYIGKISNEEGYHLVTPFNSKMNIKNAKIVQNVYPKLKIKTTNFIQLSLLLEELNQMTNGNYEYYSAKDINDIYETNGIISIEENYFKTFSKIDINKISQADDLEKIYNKAILQKKRN